jgi:KaiC/GvpD/RAD55 family RecA-like ATPase
LSLAQLLSQLPDDFEVILRPKGGTVTYTDRAAGWLSDDGRLHHLEDFELVSEIHLPNGKVERPDIDWSTFWSQTITEHDWLIDPIIPRGRSIALFAPAGEGKSELVLALACQAATKGVSVLYLDFEMTTADLMDRLYDMEYGPETDLSSLHYMLHPTIPTLDTAEGGQALAELAAARDAQLIIIDTFMRIVAGKENDADTLLAYDLHTGRLLKSAGRTVLRVDHAGKDVTLGARGTSAKRDDVDLIWRLQRREGGVRLKAEKRRMGWIPEYVDLTRNEFPVTYGEVPATWPEGTKRLAKLLDDLGIDPELGRPSVRAILKEQGETAKNSLLSAAIKYRREYHHQLVILPEQDRGQHKGQVSKSPGQRDGQFGVSINDTPPVGKDFQEGGNTPPGGALVDEYEPDLDDLPEPW